MRKIIGVIGSSMVGDQPFSRDAWSGSSYYFFTACKESGILERAFGFDLPFLTKYLIIAKNFHVNKGVWHRKFYMDTTYRTLLTQQITKYLSNNDLPHVFLQIGAAFNVPEALKNKALCCSYHDGNFAEYLKSPFRYKQLNQKQVDRCLEFEREVYEAQHHIFTMSEYLKKSFIEDFGIEESKVTCIGCGVNMDSIPDVSCKAKHHKKRNILFIGKDFERKGGVILLNAFKLVRKYFPDAGLHIIGPNPPSDTGQASNEEGAVWHGYVDKTTKEGFQKIDRIFREASIFTLPSLYEPFGIAPLEAMLYEIPCIVTNKWALKESVQDGLTGLHTKCGDAKDLAEKIIYLLHNEEKRQEMGRNARRRVINNHLWSRVVERLTQKIASF